MYKKIAEYNITEYK